VFALSWGRYDTDVGNTVKTFGIFMINWYARDFGQEWNNFVTTYYAMVQGFFYKSGKFNPEPWKGLLDLNTVRRIERFPRHDFDKIR
jgi:hypothetical protein